MPGPTNKQKVAVHVSVCLQLMNVYNEAERYEFQAIVSPTL